MPLSAAEFYEERKETYHHILSVVSKKIRRFGWYRLIAFLLIFIPLVFWGWNGWLTVIPSVALTLLFFFLVKKNSRLERKKRTCEILYTLSADELLALNHRFSHFENGADFLNPSHFNSYDLDLFGEGSVFQYINRTSTQSGRQKLAGWLQESFLQKEEIEQRQSAVKELSEMPEWRLNFLAKGHLFRETAEQSQEIGSWATTELHLERSSFLRRVLIAVPVLTVLAGAWALMGGSSLFFVLLVFTQWSLLFYYRKKITQFYAYFGRKSELLEKYMHLLHLIEKTDYKAPLLKDLQLKIVNPDTASHIFSQLKKQVNQFDFRQNVVINLLFNSLFLWDIRCTYNLWNWHRRHRKKLVRWIEVMAETDALISLANLAFNHPEFYFPEIHEGGFTLQAKKIGHPLIPAAKRVDNDFKIAGWGKVMIITGANMAGKSTFLRTIGVNLVLGRTGAPVCAERLVFTPVKIYTNMRTTDSLLKDESYFFAELKRIKTVLERLEKGERIFVILDEMLKGTNSVDKLNGSRQLIKKLLELKAVALIATHDLKISEMEEEHPQMVYNKCFEIKLENNEMVFDYLLKDGATKTMNATFLMKKMGII